MADIRVAFRVANYDRPLWVNSNRSAARFNLAEEAPTQYLTLHPLGCSAEYIRGHELRDADSLAERLVRIWVVKVDLEEAGRLTFDTADDHGMQAHDLIADDYGPCQSWASDVRADPTSPSTWVVPSAALPGTENIVVFGARVMSSFGLPSQDPFVDMPSTVVADYAFLPEYLLPLVRFPGDDHAAFEAWIHGDTYTFEDPPQYPAV